MKIQNANLSVIVGRFQTDELNLDILDLIRTKIKQGDNYILLVIGLSPLKATKQNPFDYETRKLMLENELGNGYYVRISYIKDNRNDEVWSNNLDTIIDKAAMEIGTGTNVIIYGNFTTVCTLYTGKYVRKPLPDTVIINDDNRRKEIGSKIKATADFRAGVLWATQNQYPKVYPTVDIAIIDEANQRILMARKPNETQYRFVGGFVDPKETYEQSAIRELKEETNLDGVDPIYCKSFVVNDWRYAQESDGITTSLFLVKNFKGRAKPQDDIAELRYFNLADINTIDIVHEHKPLLQFIATKINENKQ